MTDAWMTDPAKAPPGADLVAFELGAVCRQEPYLSAYHGLYHAQLLMAVEFAADPAAAERRYPTQRYEDD